MLSLTDASRLLVKLPKEKTNTVHRLIDNIRDSLKENSFR